MRFDLKRIQASHLTAHLRKILVKENATCDEESLGAIVRASGGSVRDSLSLLDQALVLSEKNITFSVTKKMMGLSDRANLFSLVQGLVRSDMEGILALTRTLIADGADPVLLCESLLDLIYWLAALKTHPVLASDITWPEKDRQMGAEMVKDLTVVTILRLWQSLLKGYDDLLKAPDPIQALDMILMRLCFVKELPPLEDVLKRLGGGTQQSSQPFRPNL